MTTTDFYIFQNKWTVYTCINKSKNNYKFWAVCRVPSTSFSWLTWYGRIGTKGSYISEHGTQAALLKKVHSKTSKGYEYQGYVKRSTKLITEDLFAKETPEEIEINLNVIAEELKLKIAEGLKLKKKKTIKNPDTSTKNCSMEKTEAKEIEVTNKTEECFIVSKIRKIQID